MYLFIHLYNFYSSRETFVEREQGESANDRNDRAIRVAAKWYSQHLKTSESDEDRLRVVLLTDDQGNKQKAEESNLLVYKCQWCFLRERKCNFLGCDMQYARDEFQESLHIKITAPESATIYLTANRSRDPVTQLFLNTTIM